MTVNIDGAEYAVLCLLTGTRVIIDYGGAVVLADCVGGSWDLSGDPATPDEQKIIDRILAPEMDTTVVTVTK